MVAYLGVDPRVYQSAQAARQDLKARLARARWALVEAARSVAQQPGPMHAFYERLRARPATTSPRRRRAKLAMLFYCMLTREQDYAHQQPSLTAKKMRLLEVRAGAPSLKGPTTGVFATRERMRHAERELAQQAEASYKRMVADWQAASPKKERRARA